MQTVTIIGAGPAGLLLAHYLLQYEQYRVELYERRANPLAKETPAQQARHRTFPMSLQQRGIKAISGIAALMPAVESAGILTRRTLMYSKRGSSRTVERQRPLLLINRRLLVRVLLERLQLCYGPERVNLQFDCVCTGLDTESRSLRFSPEQGTDFTVRYDHLVAADGARSQIRTALASTDALQCEQSVVPDVYRPVTVPRQSEALNIELSSECIHAWTINQGTRLLMVPQPGNQLEGTLIFNPQKDPLAVLSSGDEVRSFFQQHCSPIGKLMTSEAAEKLLQQPAARILSVRCDRMHVGDRIALIGDAVHAVSPAIGQGCNAALQDAQTLANCLVRHQYDWSQALPAFTEQRLPEAHALRELSDYSFPRSRRMMLEFVIRATLGKKLKPWLPRFTSPMPLSMIMDGEQPYTEVLQQCQGWVNRVRHSMPIL